MVVVVACAVVDVVLVDAVLEDAVAVGAVEVDAVLVNAVESLSEDVLLSPHSLPHSPKIGINANPLEIVTVLCTTAPEHHISR